MGTLKNSPVMVHFPQPGPRAPATPSALRPEGTPRPPAASRLSSRPTEFLETRRFLVLPGQTWWRSVSQGPQKVKLPQDPCSPQSHPTIAWTSSFSCNVSRPCGYLAKFLFYRTMAASVSCQESDQDPVWWETSRHLCVANTDSKPHPGRDPGPFTAQAPTQAPWRALTNFGINYEHLGAGNELTGPRLQDGRTSGWTGDAPLRHLGLGRGLPRCVRMDAPARAGVISMVAGPGRLRMEHFLCWNIPQQTNSKTGCGARPGGPDRPPSPRCFPALRAVRPGLPLSARRGRRSAWPAAPPSQDVLHLGNTDIKPSPAPGGTGHVVPFPAAPRSSPNREEQRRTEPRPFTSLAPHRRPCRTPSCSSPLRVCSPRRPPLQGASPSDPPSSPGRGAHASGSWTAAGVGRGAGFVGRTIPRFLRAQSPGPPRSWP